MRSSRWGLALGLFNPITLVRAAETVTVRVPTGTCAPGAYTGTFNNNGGSGAGTGVPGGPPKIVTEIDSSYGSYTLQGCYDASSGGYTITGATTSTSLTLESCATFCKGSPYIAIENGNTCICGSGGPSGPGVDIGQYGCMTPCTGNGAQCGGSPRYAIVYHCPRCGGAGSGSSTVVAYTTTDSKGSTYVTSTTSALPSTTVVVFSTTNSQGSTFLTSTTSTLPATSPSTSVVVYSTTDSRGSTYVTSTTSTAPPNPNPTGPSVIAVTNTQTVITTDANGSTVTSIRTATTSSTTTQSGNSPATTSSVTTLPTGVCHGGGTGGIYADVSGQLYEISCGTDFPGNDLATPHIDTFQQCLLQCSQYVPSPNVFNNAACIGVSYGYGNVGGNCYLKYAITTVNTGNGGFDSARMVGYNNPNAITTSLAMPPISSGASATSSQQGTNSPTVPQNTPTGGQSSPALGGSTTPAGGQSTPVPGGNTNTAGGQSTPAPGGSTTPAGQSTPVLGGSTTPSPAGPGSQTSTTPVSPASSVDPAVARYPCPTFDGVAYTDTDGVEYRIECGANYPGSDLQTPHVDTFQQCLLACDAYTSNPNVAGGATCIGVSWGRGNVGGNCYLKFSIGSTLYGDQNFDSGYLSTYNKPGGSSLPNSNTPTSNPTPVTPPAGGGSTTPVTPPAGGGSTTPVTPPAGGGSTTPVTPPAGGGSTTPVTPPAGGGSTTPVTPPAGGGTSTTAGAAPAESTITTPPQCPLNNNTIYSNVFGTSYHVKCGFNLVGNNGKPAHADTFEECLEFCDILNGCAGVTFQAGAGPTFSNCYPYSTFLSYSSGAPEGVLSGVPVNGPTNNPVGQGAICPAANGTTYVDVFGGQYSIGCGYNLAGDNLYATQTNSLKGCLTYCTTYDTCKGVIFQGTEGGPLPADQAANCFPKSSVGATSVNGDQKYAIRV